VTSSLGTVSGSKWFMSLISPTSPIRMPPSRDSCKPLSQAFLFSCCLYYLFVFTLSFSFRNENAGFRRIVEKLERSPVCQRLPLRSFLVLPFQRITRIKLLVQVCMYVCVYVCVNFWNRKAWWFTACISLYHFHTPFPEHCEENHSWYSRGDSSHQIIKTSGEGTVTS